MTIGCTTMHLTDFATYPNNQLSSCQQTGNIFVCVPRGSGASILTTLYKTINSHIGPCIYSYQFCTNGWSIPFSKRRKSWYSCCSGHVKCSARMCGLHKPPFCPSFTQHPLNIFSWLSQTNNSNKKWYRTFSKKYDWTLRANINFTCPNYQQEANQRTRWKASMLHQPIVLLHDWVVVLKDAAELLLWNQATKDGVQLLQQSLVSLVRKRSSPRRRIVPIPKSLSATKFLQRLNPPTSSCWKN